MQHDEHMTGVRAWADSDVQSMFIEDAKNNQEVTQMLQKYGVYKKDSAECLQLVQKGVKMREIPDVHLPQRKTAEQEQEQPEEEKKPE